MQSYSFTNTTSVGDNSPTAMLNVAPTLTIGRSTADPINQTLNMTGIICVNFIAGMNATIQTATLPAGTATLLFVNSQPGLVILKLDTGASVGGVTSAQGGYQLTFGNPVQFQWNGTNLS